MKNCLWFILFITAGCGLFKNKVTTTDKSTESVTAKTQMKLIQNLETKKEDQSLLFSYRSADLDYVVQLWPNGVFTYSAENGFSGEADSLQIRGHLKTGQTDANQINIIEESTTQLQKELNEVVKKISTQKHQKETKSVAWYWVMASVVLVGIGFLWYKNSFIKY